MNSLSQRKKSVLREKKSLSNEKESASRGLAWFILEAISRNVEEVRNLKKYETYMGRCKNEERERGNRKKGGQFGALLSILIAKERQLERDMVV